MKRIALLSLVATPALADDAAIERQLQQIQMQQGLIQLQQQQLIRQQQMMQEAQEQRQGIGIIGIHGAPIGTDNPLYAPVSPPPKRYVR